MGQVYLIYIITAEVEFKFLNSLKGLKILEVHYITRVGIHINERRDGVLLIGM